MTNLLIIEFIGRLYFSKNQIKKAYQFVLLLCIVEFIKRKPSITISFYGMKVFSNQKPVHNRTENFILFDTLII